MTTVAIERIAAGGDGVGHLEDGRIVFVPRTAAGDRVEVQVRERKPRFARASLLNVVEPSPARITPPCPHYTRDHCGGCQLQHLSADAQLAAKRQIVADSLQRIAGRATAVPPAEPSAAAWRYRTKITLAVQGEVIGLHPHNAPGSVFQLEDCLITSEPLMGLWQVLKAHRDTLPAGATALVLRQDREGGRHVIAEGGLAPWDAAPLAKIAGDGVTIWWKPSGGAARVVAGPRTGFPATAFEQVNPALAGVIRAAAVKSLGEVGGRTVWDLYGGVGDTARALAAAGARVWSVDADRSAVEWAAGRDPAGSYVAGKVEDVLGKLPDPDAVIVNPPRTGMDARVTASLDRWAGSAADRRLAYVSCDPATLSRDLKRLPAMQLLDVTAYDLFPQTAHVETLAVLES